jgi:hypothetical protein
MRQECEREDLIEVWICWRRIRSGRGTSWGEPVGVRAVAEFLEVEARFPEDVGEIPLSAVSCVAEQVKVAAEEWASYDWLGRANRRHDRDPGRVRPA